MEWEEYYRSVKSLFIHPYLPKRSCYKWLSDPYCCRGFRAYRPMWIYQNVHHIPGLTSTYMTVILWICQPDGHNNNNNNNNTALVRRTLSGNHSKAPVKENFAETKPRGAAGSGAFITPAHKAHKAHKSFLKPSQLLGEYTAQLLPLQRI